MHKTQGMDRADLRRFTRGLSLYRLMRSNSTYERDTTTFFGGMNLWDDASLTPLQNIKAELSKLRQDITQDSLLDVASGALRMIARSQKQWLSARASRIVSHWQGEIERTVRISCGVSASFEFADNILVPNQKTTATVQLKSSSCQVSEVTCSFDLPARRVESSTGWTVSENGEKRSARDFEFRVSENPIFTLPKSDALYNSLELEESIAAHARCKLKGRDVSFTLHSAFDIAPSISLKVNPRVTRISPSKLKEGKKFTFTVKNFQPNKTAGRVSVELPSGWKGEAASFIVPAQDSASTGAVAIMPSSDAKPGEYRVRFKTENARAEAVVKIFDVSVDDDIQLGIIKSYDNTLEAAAEELGVKFKPLDAKDLEGDLSAFNTIVVDIRAYLVRDDLKRNNQRLLEYVKRGGHLVVLYQKDQDWKPEYAPYPFGVGRKRVSVEEAPIRILQPDHPLFHAPNTITDADWEDWLQERGVYFPENVAPQYVQLLSSNDPDELPLTTGCLFANYGSGSYIYTSYVWYRQLKEYNVGGWRNFVNMICYPNHRKSSAP
jgi:hypothetical protein